MAFYNVGRGALQPNPAPPTKDAHSRQRKLFKSFLENIDSSRRNYYHGAPQGLKRMPEFKIFLELDTVEKVLYISAFASTLARNAKSLRNIHYVDFALSNPKGVFDYERAQVDRAHLLTANSSGTCISADCEYPNSAHSSYFSSFQART